MSKIYIFIFSFSLLVVALFHFSLCILISYVIFSILRYDTK